MERFLSTSPSETIHFARSFASSLKRNAVVTLIGDLGSGKTQFVKGVCQYFRVRDSVASPTFVMLHRYVGLDRKNEELLLYHFDLYKVKAASEILELGYEEFLRGDGICLIEWADKLQHLTPGDRIEVQFSLGHAENERQIVVEKYSETVTKDAPRGGTMKNVRREFSRY